MVSQGREWDATVDLLVVGLGAAGTCAAIEAAAAGAQVLAVDRFDGGGATRRSGGVIYAGGGTRLQRRHGFDDDVQRMLAYVEAEAGGVVDRAVLRAFCERSRENIDWLERHGVEFGEAFYPGKATEPPAGVGLYYSGNEWQLERARPPPRGHVPDGGGRNGRVLYEALCRAAIAAGVRIRRWTRAVELVTDGSGAVVGAVLEAQRPAPLLRAAQRGLLAAAGLQRRLAPALTRLERSGGRRERVRARGGVVLASGGFVYSADRMRRRAPAFAGCMPLGTPGDDGAALRLGAAVGAASDELDACAALRFISPPEAFSHGVLVDSGGQRFCDESRYGASLGRAIAERPGGRAWLIIDAGLRRRVLDELAAAPKPWRQSPAALLSGRSNALLFLHLTGRTQLHLNRVRAPDPQRLARKLGLPEAALARTLEQHNRALAAGRPDDRGKPGRFRASISEPPFEALACHLDHPLLLTPCFTLGGLRTDPLTGRVLASRDGRPIAGLYGAGRAAVGVCSRSYVSGLSLADCVFSGRNAGRHAAARAASGR